MAIRVAPVCGARMAISTPCFQPCVWPAAVTLTAIGPVMSNWASGTFWVQDRPDFSRSPPGRRPAALNASVI